LSKDKKMKLKSGIAFIIAAVAFGTQARDMNSIQQSGELRVGVPGDYAPLAFHNKVMRGAINGDAKAR
jgi:cyclohexadienyl dehydratase